jgi:GNAT superfamily N-acetyltransferase
MADFVIRQMTSKDRSEVAELIYISINHWYQVHGQSPIFQGGPAVTDVFYHVYEQIDPGCGLVAEQPDSGRLMGSCYYHPREHHISLGIMNVHPNHFGSGAGRALLDAIIEISEQQGKPLRLTQSALNLDSFSLYNKSGFVPRQAFQDMYLEVPEDGIELAAEGKERVRPATLDDVEAMIELEMAVSKISREQDYRFAINNLDGYWKTLALPGEDGQLQGFMIACGHSAMNMLGPCVARDEQSAAALIATAFNCYPGRAPVTLIPVDAEFLVSSMYSWGARNCELHFCQVLGEFHPFDGISMPSFLPETG